MTHIGQPFRASRIPRVEADLPQKTEDVLSYIQRLARDLSDFFRWFAQFGADERLLGAVHKETLEADFVLTIETPLVDIRAEAPVTSDATLAIKAGQSKQWAIIVNVGANAITIKTNAGTRFNGGVDLVLGQYDAVSIRWLDDASLWVETGRSNN
jgi:hypothetical protein